MELATMNDEDLDALRVDVLTEQERRQKIATIPEQMGSMNADYLAAEGVQQGDAWEQPTGYENVYPKDWVVAHNDKEWTSNIDGNALEPGVSGWTQVVAEGDSPPEWVDPPGYQDAYNIGDRVTFEGAVYESTIDKNTWSPTDYPAGWQQL